MKMGYVEFFLFHDDLFLCDTLVKEVNVGFLWARIEFRPIEEKNLANLKFKEFTIRHFHGGYPNSTNRWFEQAKTLNVE